MEYIIFKIKKKNKEKKRNVHKKSAGKRTNGGNIEQCEKNFFLRVKAKKKLLTKHIFGLTSHRS